MFYDKYAQLCKQRGVSMSAAAVEAGLSKSLVTKWKVNQVEVPSPDVLKKLSAYFGIPVSELLGEEETKKATIDVVDDDLREYLDELRTRPEMRMLFSTTKNATKAQIEAIVQFIEGMQEKK